MSAAPGRGGWLLPEILVGAMLGVVVVGALVGLVQASLAGNRVVAERAEALETVRTIWVVLEEELGPALPGRDWTVEDDGVLTLRAFRGFGRVCEAVDDVVSLGYRGRRLPDPARDSLLVLTRDGLWIPSAFERERAGDRCAPEAGEEEVAVSGLSVPAAVVVLVRAFERGSYHLEDEAFRYRRGGGGRQPLTAERLAAGSGFDLAEGGATVRVEVQPGRGIGPFVWRLPGGWP